jgi:hypothetical protein
MRSAILLQSTGLAAQARIRKRVIESMCRLHSNTLAGRRTPLLARAPAMPLALAGASAHVRGTSGFMESHEVNVAALQAACKPESAPGSARPGIQVRAVAAKATEDIASCLR